MTYQLPALPLLDRLRRNLPQPQTVVLLALLLATLVMPVSYRAGADHAHAHTIFQGLIDTITGHSHHHGEPVDESRAAPVSPFAPAAIPLSVHANLDDSHDRAAGLVSELDPPQQLGLSTPISAFAAIQALGLLIATLLAGANHRALWQEARRLLTRTVRVEIPPPRLA